MNCGSIASTNYACKVCSSSEHVFTDPLERLIVDAPFEQGTPIPNLRLIKGGKR